MYEIEFCAYCEQMVDGHAMVSSCMYNNKVKKNKELESRIAELEEVVIEATKVGKMALKHIEELERQNALYKKSNDYYSDRRNWTGRNSFQLPAKMNGDTSITRNTGQWHGGKLARETKEMIDGE